MMISNSKKAVIHIAKQQIGMTDEEYRDILSSVGVKSSKQLTSTTFDQVMAQFEKLGFRTTGRPRPRRAVKNLPASKQALMKKLEAILIDMDLSWGYVDSIASKRFRTDRAQWLDPEPLYKLVQMMAVYQKRQKKKSRLASGGGGSC